ncbi:hypothetical protein PFLA_a3564 [Pseudoalteromonas flavipulchra NCIMB 2033 = ATCC BAA-314]|nr:hypothetical protein [Pseudoalteromonas flavipulchra NCIMB 2033 = ATCC BAA-314]
MLISVTVDMKSKSPAQGFFYAQNLFLLRYFLEKQPQEY